MSNLVPGHTLRFEGAPFLLTETGQPERVSSGFWGGVSGYGRGLCSCGEMSPLLTSAHQRKKWHREHKAQIAANPTPNGDPA